MRNEKKINWLLFVCSPVLALIDKVFVGKKNTKKVSFFVFIASILVFIYALLKINW